MHCVSGLLVPRTVDAYPAEATGMSKSEDSLRCRSYFDAVERIAALESQRLQDPDKEWSRLLQNHRIAGSMEQVLASENPVDLGFFVFQPVQHLSLQHKIKVAQVLELREALKDDFYVFTHGQNLNLFLVTLFVTKLLERHGASPYFQYLRSPKQLEHISTEQIRQQLAHGADDHDLGTELISADCHLESTAICESAVSFFSAKENIALKTPGHLEHIISAILSDYIFDPALLEQTSNALVALAKMAAMTTVEGCSAQGGVLYAICIPKHRGDIFYPSEKFGAPSEHFTLSHIDDLQNGIVPHVCVRGTPLQAPQVRIFAHLLQPQDGIFVIPHTTLSTSQLAYFTEAVESLVKSV